MSFSKMVTINGTDYRYEPDGEKTPVATYEGKSTDPKPYDGVKNWDRLYLADWETLTSEQKQAARAQVWMFDEDTHEWLPQ